MKKKLSLVFIIELIFFVFLFVSCPSSADDEYIQTTFYSEDGAFYFTLNEEGTGWNATHMESDTKLSDDYAIPTTFRNLPVSYLAVYDNSISKITIPNYYQKKIITLVNILINYYFYMVSIKILSMAAVSLRNS